MSHAIEFATPIIKSVGGKGKLLHEILPRLPAKIDTYYEPFAGGAAVFFALATGRRFKRAVLGDANPAFINMYTQVRDNLRGVISHLHSHDAKYSEDYFYLQRQRPLDVGPAGAARTIFLIKTCFNGLWRVNADGGLNSPFGHHEAKPTIVNVDALRAASNALQGVTLVCADFAKMLAKAGVGDVAYLDPPYLPVSTTANFVGYTVDGFEIEDQERLADSMAAAVKRGANVLLSNSDTAEARRIFGRGGWDVERITARRNINSDGAKRGAVGEILVTAPKRRKVVVK